MRGVTKTLNAHERMIASAAHCRIGWLQRANIKNLHEGWRRTGIELLGTEKNTQNELPQFGPLTTLSEIGA